MRNKLPKKSLQSFLLAIVLFSSGVVKSQSWWQENAQVTANFNNINFADNNTGWALADSMNGILFVAPVIKKTTNQGATWTTQSVGSNYYQLNSSHFFNTANGMIVGKYLVSGKGSILTTTNSGTTWTTNDTFPNVLKDVFFINSTTGWACGQNGYLIKTTNGGVTWAAQNSNALDHLFSIHFTDINNGWAVGPNGGIVHTTNGGTTWSVQTSSVSTQDHFGVFALSPTTAFAVGSNGLMIKTTNGGTTWTTVTVPTVDHIFDITFINANVGWAVGAGGNIEITTNAGTTWTAQVSNTTKDIKSVCMKNSALGWYAGKTGTVYYYGTSPAGLNEINNPIKSLKIYPNPFTSSAILNVESDVKDLQFTFTVYDILGKQVMQNNHLGTTSVINRENLDAGVYFYKIENKQQILKSGKLIIQ